MNPRGLGGDSKLMPLLGEGGFGGCSGPGIPKGKSGKKDRHLESEPIKKNTGVLQLKCFYNVAGCLDMIPLFLEGCKSDFVQKLVQCCLLEGIYHQSMVPNRWYKTVM